MFLIDSNILIYSLRETYLRNLFFQNSTFISEITRVEVLGYSKLNLEEELYFNDVFNLISIIIPSQTIFNTAISLRKTYNLKLGDSIIAATALVNDLTVYTRNLRDFEKISKLVCINPML